ncbi:hypothetical protein C1893_31045 [Pseudomonas sp. MPR-ANC1]|nr:hypothetical protein C1893_31045 [Pseudomonas sp. MPR-ANC1]
MLRAVELYQFFTVNKTSVTAGKTAHAAPQSIVLHSKKPVLRSRSVGWVRQVVMRQAPRVRLPNR